MIKTLLESNTIHNLSIADIDNQLLPITLFDLDLQAFPKEWVLVSRDYLLTPEELLTIKYDMISKAMFEEEK